MSKPENPTAFPSGGIGGYELARGMHLRDWFAGQVLQDLSGMSPEEAAEAAYEYADAMLAERVK